SLGRLLIPSVAGGRAEHVAKLLRRGFETHDGLRGGGDGDDCALAGKGPTLRDAGERRRRDRLGRRPRYLSHPAEAALARVPARGRAFAAAHQRDRGGDPGAAHAGAGDPSLLRRERLFLGQYTDHYRL